MNDGVHTGIVSPNKLNRETEALLPESYKFYAIGIFSRE